MQTIFDPSRLSDLQNVNFGAPLVEPEAAPYCAECGEFHEPQARYSEPLASGADSALYPWFSRADEHASAMRVVEAGRVADERRKARELRLIDEAYWAGRTAALENGHTVTPPSWYSRAEADAFHRGVGDVEIEENERLLRLEADAEMAHAAVWAD